MEVAEHREAPQFFDVQAADERFVVAQLRKCARGPPLLPVDGEWAAVPQLRFALSEYLMTLVCSVTSEDDPARRCRVQQHVQGRPLLVYQAAIPADDWRLVFDAVLKPFQQQRSAYRKLRGGTGAPEIFFGVEPLYGVEPERDKDSTTAPSTDEESAQTPCAGIDIGGWSSGAPLPPVSRTFIHVPGLAGDGPVGSARRARSAGPQQDLIELQQSV